MIMLNRVQLGIEPGVPKDRFLPGLRHCVRHDRLTMRRIIADRPPHLNIAIAGTGEVPGALPFHSGAVLNRHHLTPERRRLERPRPAHPTPADTPASPARTIPANTSCTPATSRRGQHADDPSGARGSAPRHHQSRGPGLRGHQRTPPPGSYAPPPTPPSVHAPEYSHRGSARCAPRCRRSPRRKSMSPRATTSGT